MTARARCRLLAAILLGLAVARPSIAAGNESPSGMDEVRLRNLSSQERERIDRMVDRAALDSLRRAISRIEALLVRQRGTAGEKNLLTKLGDLRQQRASMEFRIGLHSRDESGYRRSLREAVTTFDEVLRRFPNSDQVAQVLSWRAKAHADLQQNTAAEADYRTLIRQHAQAPEADSARMALAGYASDRGDHAEALRVLEPLAAKPESPFHPFALHQMAWAAFNRGDISAAVDYCRRNVAALRKKAAAGTQAPSDDALLENTLLDVATFVADRIEKDPQPPSAKEVLGIFRRFDPGPRLSAMALRFAKLLRAHDQVAILSDWSRLAWTELASTEAAVEIDHLAREHALLRRDFAAFLAPLPESARSLIDGPAFEPHRRLYSKLASEIHELLGKNASAKSAELQPWIERLGLAYQRFLTITPPADPRFLQARLNLADAHRSLGRREEAIVLYREIVASNEWKNGAVIQASLASIALQIENLEDKKKLPKTLALLAADAPREDTELSGLLGWIELHRSRSPEAATGLDFERARVLYVLGRRTDSLAALADLVRTHPESKDAEAAVALLLDTELFSKHLTAIDSRITALTKIRALIANSGAAKALDEATLRRDVLALETATDGGLRRKARDRLLARKDAPPEVRDAALIDRAKEEDASGKSAEALATLREASNPASRGPALALLAYASENWKVLQEISTQGCGSNSPLCTQLSQWLASRREASLRDAVAELRRLSRLSGTSRLLAALPLLKIQEKLGYRDRNLLIRLVSQGWGELMPLLQWEILPEAIAAVPRMLEKSREQIRSQAPLSATQKTEAHLVHRMDVIREFENAVQAALAIPVEEIRSAALRQQAQAMRDFSDDLGPLAEIAAGARPALQKRAEGMLAETERRSSELSAAVKKGEAFIAGNPQLATTMKLDRSRLRWFFENASSLPAHQQALWLGWILWNAGARQAAAEQWAHAAPAITAAVR